MKLYLIFFSFFYIIWVGLLIGKNVLRVGRERERLCVPISPEILKKKKKTNNIINH